MAGFFQSVGLIMGFAQIDSGNVDSRFTRKYSRVLQWLATRSIGRVFRRRGKSESSQVEQVLRHFPLGLFYYNQRILFLGAAAFYGFGLFLYWYSILACHTTRNLLGILLISLAWLIAAVGTIVIRIQLKRLSAIGVQTQEFFNEWPPVLVWYFRIDFFAILSVVVLGYVLGLKSNHYIVPLVGILVLYGAFVGKKRELILLTSLLLGVIVLVSVQIVGPMPIEEEVTPQFEYLFAIGPILGALVGTILSLQIIYVIREIETSTIRHRFDLIDKYREWSRLAYTPSPISSNPNPRAATPFQKAAKKIMDDLCSQPKYFWAKSASIWFVANHQTRGAILLPALSHDTYLLEDSKAGIELKSSDILGPWFVFSTRMQSAPISSISALSTLSDAPAAGIPIKMGENKVGVLMVFGAFEGNAARTFDRILLREVSYVLSDALENNRLRKSAEAAEEIEGLFKLKSLEEVFSGAAKIMRKFLRAEGCMVAFRDDPNNSEITVVAQDGFRSSMVGVKYDNNSGQTFACANHGKTIRYDDVESNRSDFDPVRLSTIETALGRAISSWMSIPIGQSHNNFGVIKVVNRAGTWNWFTNEDQQFGETLAFRLTVIISKFLEIHRRQIAVQAVREALKRAEEHAKRAEEANRQAQELAARREMDLMAITHQLQGPLIGASSQLSVLREKTLPENAAIVIRKARAFVDDALCIAQGIHITFARHYGQEIDIDSVEIDAPSELRSLCERLDFTQNSNRLKFEYKIDDGFPNLSMNRDVFASVAYSLIHNAMKYADEYSTVYLMCTFELATGEAALKVKSRGIPIQRHETEFVFTRFGRGHYVKSSGLHPKGVGLGLWVARELMQAVHGDLTVELDPKDEKLSVFIVRFP